MDTSIDLKYTLAKVMVTRHKLVLEQKLSLTSLHTYKGKTTMYTVTIFFTSPSLFLHLLEKGIYACGTVRQRTKGFPVQLKVPGKKGKKAPAKLV